MAFHGQGRLLGSGKWIGMPLAARKARHAKKPKTDKDGDESGWYNPGRTLQDRDGEDVEDEDVGIENELDDDEVDFKNADGTFTTLKLSAEDRETITKNQILGIIKDPE